MSNLIDNIKINERKQKELSDKIFEAMEKGEEFRILSLDIDNTLINDNPIRTRMLKEILGEEYDITMQRANELYSTGNPDDIALSSILIGNMLDKVLEEGEPRFVGKMNYKLIYCIENFFPGVIEFVNRLLNARKKNDFIVLDSHKNVIREAHDKINLGIETFPTIDGIYLPNYHDEPFGIPGRQAVSKVEHLSKKIISNFRIPVVTNLHINITINIFHVDDSSTVLIDTLSKGASIVPFLPSKIPPYIEGRNYLDDFLARASKYCDMSKVVEEKSNLDSLNKTMIK